MVYPAYNAFFNQPNLFQNKERERENALEKGKKKNTCSS